MEKISGILPSSSRITTVDLSSSGAARPGSPSFGRRVGDSDIEKNSIVRSAHSALQRSKEVRTGSKEEKQADLAQNISDSFFKRKSQRDKEAMLVRELIADDIAAQQAREMASLRPFDAVSEIAGEVDSQAYSLDGIEAASNEESVWDQPEVGRYIDIEA